MAYKYAKPGPPFNFLGNFSRTQWDSFKGWADGRSSSFPEIQEFHQIRAQQLRKTAGLLGKFYKEHNDEKLTPSFVKDAWKPGPHGHFSNNVEDDHLPMVTMSKIKNRFKEQLQRQDEAVFHMNHLSHLIEKHEDMAQYAKEITGTGDGNLKSMLDKIEGYFGQVEYESVLVDDTRTYGPDGDPYFRVHPFDPPTRWELEQMNHGSGPIKLKEEDAQ